MKRPTAAEINARNRKRAQYRSRLEDRLWNTSSGPVEITPELERALNTPLNDLPVDHTLRRALERAGGTGDYLAHVRLAKVRQRRRMRERTLRVVGGLTKARAQRERTLSRNRRIWDAVNVQNKAPKQLEADQKIRGKKKLSASQIRRISKGPRP